MIFSGEQITVRRLNICPDQDGLACLEDLIVGADPNRRKFLNVVHHAGLGHRLVNDVAHRAQTDLTIVEHGV